MLKDYDCFYAAVFEAENPALKSLPLAVQQKHIIVTCNYEARRRGLYKLQLVTDAKRICPELIIVLGEDISRFRDASKELYNFLTPFSWSRKVERLGFDEVWFDVSDVVDYNVDLLNRNDLARSFFQLSKEDPTLGFDFDANIYRGSTYPSASETLDDIHPEDEEVSLRLRLGSHLAMHMRRELEHHKGYTATVGIATNKVLSKLVGNVNKPNGQTTLIPPLANRHGIDPTAKSGNPIAFLDPHDIGKIPGIGFKMAQKLRAHILQRPPDFDKGLIYGGTLEKVTVRDVRLEPSLAAETIDQLLAGVGVPHGAGARIWNLIHGIDDTPVAPARAVPRQISIEDSYLRLSGPDLIDRELRRLSVSLLTRMRIDLLAPDLDADEGTMSASKWLAHPRTLRLTTRPKAQRDPSGAAPQRSFKRISHSAPLPNFVFAMPEETTVEVLADRLANEALLPMYKRLHPRAKVELSLINIAVTNMAEAAGDTKSALGRDIGGMFRRQEDVLRDFRVIDEGEDQSYRVDEEHDQHMLSADEVERSDDEEYHQSREEEKAIVGDGWITDNTTSHNKGDTAEYLEDEDEAEDAAQLVMDGQACSVCGVRLPPFALEAHERFHALGD